MSRRSILALSAALSAFVLVLAGAAASYSLRRPSVPAAQAVDSVPADVTQHALDRGGGEQEEHRSGRHEHRRAHREDDDG